MLYHLASEFTVESAGMVHPSSLRLRRLTTIACAGLFCLAGPAADAAENYPQRPIRMIVGFAPGGGTDIVARIAGKGITEYLGQPVVVDNRPGGGGNIASDIVAKSAPDGYTLITGGTGSHAINPSLFAKLPFDAVADFSPVCLVAATPYLLVIHPSVSARSVRQFIDLVKSAPGKINMASAGNGSMGHLGGELFKMMAGLQPTDMTHIPYKGTGSLFPDLLSGSVHMSIGDVVATYPFVRSGRLLALGITSPKRAPRLPDIPTVSESGVPGYEAVGWFGVFAPARTPAAIITTLNGAIVKYVTRPETKELFAELGADVVASTPAEYARIQKADVARWAKVIKASGARIE